MANAALQADFSSSNLSSSCLWAILLKPQISICPAVLTWPQETVRRAGTWPSFLSASRQLQFGLFFLWCRALGFLFTRCQTQPSLLSMSQLLVNPWPPFICRFQATVVWDSGQLNLLGFLIRKKKQALLLFASVSDTCAQRMVFNEWTLWYLLWLHFCPCFWVLSCVLQSRWIKFVEKQVLDDWKVSLFYLFFPRFWRITFFFIVVHWTHHPRWKVSLLSDPSQV